MLATLTIRNYAIIDEIEIQFSEGLNIITGETGAGKSIILEALGLILGRRADTKKFLRDDSKSIIEGVFRVKGYKLEAFFGAHDLDYDDEVIIRREIKTDGKSRAFINDSPVAIKVLQQLSSHLIDVHNQFDSLDIQNADFQLKLIDAIADNANLLDDYRLKYREWDELKSAHKTLSEKASNMLREQDYLQFQYNELEKLSIEAKEDIRLEDEKKTLESIEEIQDICSQANQLFVEGDFAINGQIDTFLQQLRKLSDLGPQWTQLTERLNSVQLELEDIQSEFELLAAQQDQNPLRLNEIQLRLNDIYRLQQKHNVSSSEELVSLQQSLADGLNRFSNLDNELREIEHRIKTLEPALEKQAKAISTRRINVVHNFENKVQDKLAQLMMLSARLKVEITKREALNADGQDDLQFLFSTNKGSPFQKIQNASSGGEMSRLSLAVKSLIADEIELPTLVFDEIDTGVSGDAAIRMGGILDEISSNHQIISITHSPQVAIYADEHLLVYKEEVEETTKTRIKALAKKERVHEIATMIAGAPPGSKAIANAKELMKMVLD